ncbi:MAG: hypothetical protein II821_03440 [Treponema sp.]|nr:hypothetical protein [Treponema sp.]
MKKSLFTAVAVTALVFGLGTSSAFAKAKQNPYGHPSSENSERSFDPKNFDFQMQKHPMHQGFPGGPQKFDYLGTISSVDTEKQLITLKDADGNETKIHVNPFTRTGSFDLPTGNPCQCGNPNCTNKSLPAPDTLKLEELKAGDWIAVKKFDTDTKTVEAAGIIVSRAK